MNIIKELLGASGGSWPQGSDKLMVRPPMEEGKDKNVVTPDQLGRNQGIAGDKRNIYDDSGKIVDYDMGAGGNDAIGKLLKQQMMDINKNLGKRSEAGGAPFAELTKALNGEGGKGSFFGTLNSFLSPDRERNQTGNIDVGSATSADLNPVPSKEQPQANLQSTIDYRTKTVDPKSIQELRASLYKDAGQGAPPLASVNTDPNSLAGRMQSPNYEAEKKAQMQEGQDTSDRFSLQPRATKKNNTNPFATLFPGRQ